jgi:hypothetical protein
MKMVTSALILALTLAAGTAAAEQGKGKGKSPDKKSPPTTSGRAGGGSCAPDKTPPVIHSVTAAPNVLQVPNHRMTPVSISANVTDNCPGVTWAVTAVASDEPINGTGDGDTTPDWTIGAPHTLSLRAERAGTGDGRVYTITITAKDAANNTANATTAVTVPHNR